MEQDMIQEDEIDLRELFTTIVKYKKFIAIFVLIVTFLSFLYVLSMPNSYKSQVILMPQKQDKKLGGGLSSLAALAGVNLDATDGQSPYVFMDTMLKNVKFNEYMVKKYSLNKLLGENKNLVFALGLDLSFLHNSSVEDDVFVVAQNIKEIISLDEDKKSGFITLSVELHDRFLAKKLVDIYLSELTRKAKTDQMKDIDAQIKYYKKELENSYDVSLKEELSKSLSALMQKKVFSLANEYYFVSKVSDSYVANIKEKSKPKRALILVVGFVTSLILSMFIVFLIDFIKTSKHE